MSKPICKIADIIFVRFELIDLAPQKEYMEHFGMFWPMKLKIRFFIVAPAQRPTAMLRLKEILTDILVPPIELMRFLTLKHSQRPKVLRLLKILILVAVIK